MVTLKIFLGMDSATTHSEGCICSFPLCSDQYLLSLYTKILRGVVKGWKQKPTCPFHTGADWCLCAPTEREQKPQKGRLSSERLSCQHTSTRDGGEAWKQRRWWSLHQNKKDAKKCIPGSPCQNRIFVSALFTGDNQHCAKDVHIISMLIYCVPKWF